MYVLIQNTLFGDEGISVAELSDIFKGEVSQSTIRKSISYLKENDMVIINKDGKKELFDINTKKLAELKQ